VLVHGVQINLLRGNKTQFPAASSEKSQLIRDAVTNKHIMWLHRVPELTEQVNLGGVAKTVLRDPGAVINNDSNGNYDPSAGGSGVVGLRLIAVNGLGGEYNCALRWYRIDGDVSSKEEGANRAPGCYVR